MKENWRRRSSYVERKKERYKKEKEESAKDTQEGEEVVEGILFLLACLLPAFALPPLLLLPSSRGSSSSPVQSSPVEPPSFPSSSLARIHPDPLGRQFHFARSHSHPGHGQGGAQGWSRPRTSAGPRKKQCLKGHVKSQDEFASSQTEGRRWFCGWFSPMEAAGWDGSEADRRC